MKYKLIASLVFILGLNSYAFANQWDARTKSKTGFFEVSIISQFNLSDSLSHYGSAGKFKFGSHFMPQQTALFGFIVGEKSGNFSLGYEYDFVRSGDWIPGLNISAVFGMTDYKDFEESKRYLAIGADLGAFLKRSISNRFIMLLRAGISHELISVKKPPKKFSDLDFNLYLELGVRYYFF